MTLYLEPPSGNISLQTLETFALKRLQLLLKVQATHGDVCRLQEIMCEESVVASSDCLIAGSMKDKVSHFILRLLMGGDPEMRTFFTHAETTLFDFHLSCMSEDEMQQFFQKVDKLLWKLNLTDKILKHSADFQGRDINCILAVFNNIKNSSALSWKDVIKFYLSQSTSRTFVLPFQCVLSLLSRRDVQLDKGMAKVPVCRLREVVTEQFCSLMKIATTQAVSHHSTAVSDGRMRILWRKLKLLYRSSSPSVSGGPRAHHLSLEEVDDMAPSYPLCMSSLLQSLRQKHRLGHHARIQLTLFLKEMGLPVHHALALWQQEYSKPAGPGSHCSHSWQKDSRRYTYSIRHLYGLEGAQRNYHGHCCRSLQQTAVGCSAEGGCPFSHWDDEALAVKLFNLRLSTNQVTEVNKLRKSGQFSAACKKTILIHTSADRKNTVKSGGRMVKGEFHAEMKKKAIQTASAEHQNIVASHGHTVKGENHKEMKVDASDTAQVLVLREFHEAVTASSLAAVTVSWSPLKAETIANSESVLHDLHGYSKDSSAYSDGAIFHKFCKQKEDVKRADFSQLSHFQRSGTSFIAGSVNSETKHAYEKFALESWATGACTISTHNPIVHAAIGTKNSTGGCMHKGVKLEGLHPSVNCPSTSSVRSYAQCSGNPIAHLPAILNATESRCRQQCDMGPTNSKRQKLLPCSVNISSVEAQRPQLTSRACASVDSNAYVDSHHVPALSDSRPMVNSNNAPSSECSSQANLTPLCIQPPVLFTVPVAECTRWLNGISALSETSSHVNSNNSASTDAFCTTTDASLSCFEHEQCPSQQTEDCNKNHQLESIVQDPIILKPVDYFHLSYKMLLDGLR